MQYIHVRNWERFQHYKDRTPKWIKLYTELLKDAAYLRLSGRQRGILHGIWLAYAASRQRLSAKPALLSTQIGMHPEERLRKRDIDALCEAGFIVLREGPPVGQPVASTGSTDGQPLVNLWPSAGQPVANPGSTAGQIDGDCNWPSRYVNKGTRTAVLERDGNRCVACGATKYLEIDHIIPVSQWAESGRDDYAHDDPRNLQTLCRSCNRAKRVRSIRVASAEPRLEKSRETTVSLQEKKKKERSVRPSVLRETADDEAKQDEPQPEDWQHRFARLMERAAPATIDEGIRGARTDGRTDG